MKRLFGNELLILVTVILIGGGLGWIRHRLVAPADESSAIVRVFEVEGMDCDHCETGVKSKLLTLDGVIRVSVSYQVSSAEVTFDPNLVTSAEIAEVITASGFPARPLEDQQASGAT